MKSKKTIVFFDVEVGKAKAGRIKMELWNEELPHTCENFRQLCTGQYLVNEKPTGFRETCFYEISEDSLRGGDYTKNDGSGGKSIFDEPFSEETTKKIQ